MLIKKVDTKEQLEDAYKVRTKVFIDEQNVPPEIEVDENEDKAVHFVGYIDHHPVAASRLRILDDYGKLERICVLKDFRGKYYGQQIIKEMENYLASQNIKKAKLNAQTHAEEFYNRIGYETISDEFIDAGIPHVTMIKKLT